MGFTDEWLSTLEGVLTRPTEYFSEEDRRDGFGYPFKFAAVALFISGVLNAVMAAAGIRPMVGTELGSAAPAVMAGTGFLSAFVGGIVGLFIGAALIHLFVYLFGGRGYSRTLAVVSYASALSPVSALFSFIPMLGGLVGLVVGIYAIYVQGRGIQEFHGLSFGKSVAAVLLPAVLLIGLFLVVIVVFMAGASMMLGTAMTP